MKTFVVHLIKDVNRKRPDKNPEKVLFEGDSKDDAEAAAWQAYNDSQNRGLWIRFYDYHLFGGGMKDTLIP